MYTVQGGHHECTSFVNSTVVIEPRTYDNVYIVFKAN